MVRQASCEVNTLMGTTIGPLHHKFFPVYKTKEGRRKIYEFDQNTKKPLDVAWERFKSLIYACPTHRLPLYQLISIFYEGMNEQSRARINNHSHNKFIKMEPGKAWELMDELTTFDAQFGSRVEQDKAHDMSDLVQSLKACQICNSPDHSARECSALH